jgi:hypothetical protein
MKGTELPPESHPNPRPRPGNPIETPLQVARAARSLEMSPETYRAYGEYYDTLEKGTRNPAPKPETTRETPPRKNPDIVFGGRAASIPEEPEKTSAPRGIREFVFGWYKKYSQYVVPEGLPEAIVNDADFLIERSFVAYALEKAKNQILQYTSLTEKYSSFVENFENIELIKITGDADSSLKFKVLLKKKVLRFITMHQSLNFSIDDKGNIKILDPIQG